MAPAAQPSDEFAILPIQMPAVPSFPQAGVHEVRIKPHTPKLPTATDSRSLFLKNVPADSTEAHFRALFAALVGVGRFESVTFENENRTSLGIDPAHATMISGFGKKRKRDELEAGEKAKADQAARLPAIWTRKLRKSGSTAVVLLADEKSVKLVLRAVAKLHKSKKYPVWGGGIAADVPPLGAPWVTAHLRMTRADKAATQQAVHAFFNAFNRKEKEAAELAKRLRSEPDEDGFVTVVRGGRDTPANKAQAEAARHRMLEKEAKKKSETRDFYRFQLRERRKADQAALLRRFEEDREKVNAMREKRGKFRPET